MSSPHKLSLLALLMVLIASLTMLQLKLGVVLLSGLLVICLGETFHTIISHGISRAPKLNWLTNKVRGFAMAATATALVGLAVVLYFLAQFIVDQVQTQVPLLLSQVATILQTSPVSKQLGIPAFSAQQISENLMEWVQRHIGQLVAFTGVGIKTFFLGILAAIAGFSVLNGTMKKLDGKTQCNPARTALTQRLCEQAVILKICFAKFMAAQAYVAAWNTLCTAVFILGVLPLLEVQLPFRGLLLGITFVLSFLPAVGNMVCNTLMVVLCLQGGPLIAALAFGYLVVAHKAEYLINAHFLGKLQAVSIAEILVCLIVGETLFGLFGLILGPVLYLFVMQSLRAQKIL